MMNKELLKIGKSVSGNILTIGFTNETEFIVKFINNKKIKEVYTLTNKKNGTKKEKRCFFGVKKINIKKIKKLFKKKNIDYTFIELSSVDNFLHNIVKDCIDLTNENIYFIINNNKISSERLSYKFERYGCKNKVIAINNEELLVINCQNIKTTKLKNIVNFIKDINYDLQEFISYILIGA